MCCIEDSVFCTPCANRLMYVQNYVKHYIVNMKMRQHHHFNSFLNYRLDVPPIPK